MEEGKRIIVSRHEGAIKWVKSKMEGNSEVQEHFSQTDIAGLGEGDRVIGNLPLPLIAAVMEQGAEFYLIVLPIARSERGTELSLSEMEAAGAKLIRVKHLDLEEVK
jgi:CRISPR-associated protein Csx16